MHNIFKVLIMKESLCFLRSLLVILGLLIVYLYIWNVTHNATEKDKIISLRQPPIYAKWNGKVESSHSDIQMFKQRKKQDYEGDSNIISDINKTNSSLGFKKTNDLRNDSSLYREKTKNVADKIGNVVIFIAIYTLRDKNNYFYTIFFLIFLFWLYYFILLHNFLFIKSLSSVFYLIKGTNYNIFK